jgi:hypothetical protein
MYDYYDRLGHVTAMAVTFDGSGESYHEQFALMSDVN